MKRADFEDDLTHLSANYWCVTVLCGVFLAVFCHALLSGASLPLLMCLALVTTIAAYFSMRLQTQLKTMKKQRR